jgi:hypothetical protein
MKKTFDQVLGEVAVGASKIISRDLIGMTREHFTALVQRLQDGGLPEGYFIEWVKSPSDGSGSIDLVSVRRVS